MSVKKLLRLWKGNRRDERGHTGTAHDAHIDERAVVSNDPVSAPRTLDDGSLAVSHPVPTSMNHHDGHHTTNVGAHSPDASSGRSSGRSLTPAHSTGSLEPLHRSSSIGLDEYIEARRESGDFTAKMVNIQIPFGQPIEEVYDDVHTGKILGRGISGLVRQVRHKATGHEYAVKCLELQRIDSVKGLRQLREEIAIMCELDHPNIVRLEEVYESHSEIYLVQELCTGGELYDILEEQPEYRYTEVECARLVGQMLSAVRYLHSKGIIHRDLKLENFLFSSKDPGSELVLIDFGLSKHFEHGEVHHEAVGTPYTVAPEVIRGSYDERCDVWGIGVITYLLLSGDTPFGGGRENDCLAEIKSKILSGTFEYDREEAWSVVSNHAKSFIETLLVTNPYARPTAEEAQSHHWLSEWAHRGERRHPTLNPNVVRALLSFKEKDELRKLLSEVLSFTLLPDQLKGIRKEFEKIDLDGSGEISLEALKKVLMTDAVATSFGVSTDKDVEDIFDSMRLGRGESCVHWHEFIAAVLSLCQVDDRNIRLAFDRLDNLHNGYLTYENVQDLMERESEEAIRLMWSECLAACHCKREVITYRDFSFLLHEMDQHDQSQPVYSQSIGISFDGASKLRKERDGILIPASYCIRRRSRSVGDRHEDENDDLEDSVATPLVVNRALFRTHRQMRLAVLEANKRFESQKARRAHKVLLVDGKDSDLIGLAGAGLVLRHGQRERVDSDVARAWLQQTERKQEALVKRANKRSGRELGTRVRSFSDISGMNPSEAN